MIPAKLNHISEPSQNPNERPDTRHAENFTDSSHWGQLERRGKWLLDAGSGVISGQGMFDFLLSNHVYGDRNFTIRSSIRFHDYEGHRSKGSETANAGAVIGWDDRTRAYYNLLFTGTHLVIESVGARGGGDFRDFQHLGDGARFDVVEGQEYDVVVSVTESNIDVFVDQAWRYAVPSPKPLEGKVGLRPWRSRIECSRFTVTES